MISIKAHKETIEGKLMHVILSNSKCDEPGCNNTCVVKLSTHATGHGVAWQVEEAPEGWIVSMRHSTCHECAKNNEIVLIFDDEVKPEDQADPAKVEYLIELRAKIDAIKAARKNHSLMMNQIDTPFPNYQSA